MPWEETIMRETTLLGPWIRRFLLEHLVSERNLAPNTRRSYRDAMCLLIPFVVGAGCTSRWIDSRWSTCRRNWCGTFSATSRLLDGCGIATRNQRLAAIHALARFVGEHSPEHIDWCAQVRCVPYKKGTHAMVPYLDKPEIDALLACPDRRTAQGRRDYALLLFLYNSGARADEAAQLVVGDLDLDVASVHILGKGRKHRQCPLWPDTVLELRALVVGRSPQERVFLNRCGQPMTRFGVHALVERTALRAQSAMPSLATKRVSPHSIRHIDGDASAALGRRHQYRARVARPRLARHDQRLRRDRPRRKSAGARQVRGDERPRAEEAVAGQPRPDAVPALAVDGNLCGVRRAAARGSKALGTTYAAEDHITHPALGQDFTPSHTPRCAPRAVRRTSP